MYVENPQLTDEGIAWFRQQAQEPWLSPEERAACLKFKAGLEHPPNPLKSTNPTL